MSPAVKMVLCIVLFIAAAGHAQAQNLAYPPTGVLEVREIETFDGIICAQVKSPLLLTENRVTVAKKESLTVSLLTLCAQALKKAPPRIVPGQTLAIQWVIPFRTENMYCEKVLPFRGPMIWSVITYKISLSGKEKELEECLDELDKFAPPPLNLPDGVLGQMFVSAD